MKTLFFSTGNKRWFHIIRTQIFLHVSKQTQERLLTRFLEPAAVRYVFKNRKILAKQPTALNEKPALVIYRIQEENHANTVS